MASILALVLNWLGGGVLTSVLGHLEKRADSETERERIRTSVTIEEVKAEVARRNAQRDLILKDSDHWIAWLPRFIINLSGALYVLAFVLDTIFDLPGAIKDLDANQMTIMLGIIGALTLQHFKR